MLLFPGAKSNQKDLALAKKCYNRFKSAKRVQTRLLRNLKHALALNALLLRLLNAFFSKARFKGRRARGLSVCKVPDTTQPNEHASFCFQRNQTSRECFF
jgi:hypothetical protein